MGELNLHNLNSVIDKFKCTQFVETGTGKGTGLSYACSHGFNKLYSIEYMTELYEECKGKFDEDVRVTLINDTSINGLKQVLSEMDSTPALFWLDAHFPGADFYFNDYDHMKDDESHMPLVQELQLIHSSREGCEDVIILDDLQLYEDGPFQLHNPEFCAKYGNKDITPGTDLFKETHQFSRDYRHQGFLTLTPNE
jgi:hypothetical protein